MQPESPTARNPMSTLRQFVRKPQGPPAEHCELCGLALAGRALASARAGQPKACLQLRALRDPLQRPARGPVPARPARHRIIARLPPVGRAVGGPAPPINLTFFVESTPAERVLAFYPEPGRGRRIAADARGLAGPGGTESRAARARARRRGAPGQPDERRARVLPRADRRMLQAGRPDPDALARAVGGQRRSGTKSVGSSPA